MNLDHEHAVGDPMDTPIDARAICVDGTALTVRKGRHDAFWDLLARGEWEPPTILAFRRLLGQGTTFIDVGAWIGPTSLLAAALGSEVVAFEPDEAAASEFRKNLACNPLLAQHVTVYQIALADRDGVEFLNAGDAGLGDSTSTLLVRKDRKEGHSVATRDILNYVRTPVFQRCTVMKVDIEGAEYRLIPRIARFLAARRPYLLLSLHSAVVAGSSARRRPLLSRIGRRLVNAISRMKLVVSLRSYPYWYCATENGWREFGIVEKLKLIPSFAMMSLILSPVALTLTAADTDLTG